MKGLTLKLGMLLLTAMPAMANETTVTILSDDQPLIGTLNVPDAAAPAPVVLMLHGFGGTRDELASDAVPEGVFARTAARLADAGYASLRIDFRGSGDSTANLSFADTTFEGQIADAMAAVEYLGTVSSVDPNALYVIGWSQGGLVAAAAAGRSEPFAAVALWNAVGDPKGTYGALFGDDALAAAIAAPADELQKVVTPWDAEFELKGAFFDGVSTLNPIAEIANYTGPLFVASGASDTLVLPEVGASFLESHNGPNTAWPAEMDHVFNIFTEDATLEAMISETIAFFEGS